MLIYRDIFSNDELFSDSYKVKVVDDVFYEVIGKYETRKEGEVTLEGANASAEDAPEATDESSVTGISVVLNHRLVQTSFDKKTFMGWLKLYMKRIVTHLQENGRSDEVDAFKEKAQKAIMPFVNKVKDLDFYMGESMNPEAMICMVLEKDIEGDAGNSQPHLYFFKHGIEEVKY